MGNKGRHARADRGLRRVVGAWCVDRTHADDVVDAHAVSGWPIAEAQACGCPVVTTGRPPMTDVGGSAAIYIDPADPADPAGAAGAIASALTERERWRQAGLDNAAQFSTTAMIDAYARWYHQVAQLPYFSVDERAVENPTAGRPGT